MKLIWYVAGLSAFFLGIVGALLPVMPTVPFMILAAFCFAKGSPRFHRYLLQHRIFGPQIRAWEQHRAVPRRAKVYATAMLCISLPLSSYWLGWQWWWVSSMVILLCIAVMVWLWRLPDAP